MTEISPVCCSGAENGLLDLSKVRLRCLAFTFRYLPVIGCGPHGTGVVKESVCAAEVFLKELKFKYGTCPSGRGALGSVWLCLSQFSSMENSYSE